MATEAYAAYFLLGLRALCIVLERIAFCLTRECYCTCTVHALKKLTFYGRTTPTATGVLRSRLRAYYAYGYGRSTATGTGVLRLWLRAYYDYGYGRTTTTATGVRLRLRANVRVYYVNFFTAYTVCFSDPCASEVCL